MTQDANPASADHRTTALQRLLDRPVSDHDLAEAARVAAIPFEARTAKTTGVLVFRLEKELLALPAASLRRVTPVARASAIPHRRSRLLRGICSVRGELILCVDLRALLGVNGETVQSGADTQSSRRMIVLGPPDASWVFEVDALIGIERIDAASLRSAPVTVEYASSAFVTGLADLEVGCVSVLDGGRVLRGLEAALL